ncbi:MAG: hypothetical protein JNM69_26155 [Archangium sp.]|nr:hypothetical protein [Archangium sp.]
MKLNWKLPLLAVVVVGCGPQPAGDAGTPMAGGSTAGGSAAAGGSAGGMAAGGMTAGGSAGGVAGGATAGGMAGGAAGGSSGGMAPLCDGGCSQPWLACLDIAPQGQCVPGVLVVTDPVDGGTYAAGANVPLLATLLVPDGGAPWPTAIQIPVTTSWGSNLMVTSGTAGSVTGALDAGVASVTFGWSTGPTSSRPVAFTSCEAVACQAWQQCGATVTGGRCDNLLMSLTWTSPADGFRRGPLLPSMPLQVRLDTDAGVASLPATVPVLFDGGTWVLTKGATTAGSATYSAPDLVLSTPLVGVGEGPKDFVAGWPDSGVPAYSATKVVTWDTTPPVLSFRLQDAGAAWKRDERVLLRVETNEPLDVAPLVLLAGRDAGVIALASSACATLGTCTAPRCDCYQLDVATPDWPATGLATTFALAASAEDIAGNPNAAAGPVVPVTRLKWRSTVGQTGSVVRAAPVLDSVGTLYVGVADNDAGTAGRLVALQPTDGGSTVTVVTGAVQSVSVARSRVDATQTADVVYVNSNVAMGSRVDMYQTTGAPLGSPLVDTTRKTWSALALFRADTTATPEVGAAALLNASVTPALNGLVGGVTPTQMPALSTTDAEYMLPVPGATPPNSPVNAIVFGRDGGTQLIFPTDDGSTSRRLHGRRFSGGAWLGGTAGPGLSSTGSPVALSAAGVATYLALTGRERPLFVSKTLLAAVAVGPTDGGTLNTAYAPVITNRTPANGVDATAMYGCNFTGIGNSSWLLSSGTDTATALALDSPLGLAGPASTQLVTSPVIGGGGLAHGVGGSADRLYSVTADGALRVFVVSATDGVAGATPEWSATPAEVFGSVKTVYAHPTMDCSRPSAPGRPGVLYVVATDGTVAAIVVDSAKLSATAPWPKWQRTAGNAGNDDEALFPKNPGCN